MIDHLEALITVSKLGTMTEASTALRVTQSAISKRIAALEAQYGERLIEKKGRRICLTAEGRQLVDKTAPLIGEIRNAIKRKPKVQDLLFSVGVSESVLSSWGAQVLSDVKRASSVKTQLHAHRSPVVLDRVSSGDYQFGVCAGKLQVTVASL